MPAQRVEGYVIEVDGNNIVVNIGTEMDLAPGMILYIVEETTKVDPNTGMITGKSMARLGEATITKVQEKWQYAGTSQRPGTTLRAGNKVLLKRSYTPAGTGQTTDQKHPLLRPAIHFNNEAVSNPTSRLHGGRIFFISIGAMWPISTGRLRSSLLIGNDSYTKLMI